VDRHRLDDAAPYIYVTHDLGRTWARISKGIPDGAYVRSVREGPTKGLLFAATELGIYVSVDDGGSWRSLQLNMPVVPVHDLAVHGHDLIAASHGRSFWVLDDISPLEQLTPGNLNIPAYLFQTPGAVRMRPNINSDTPLPPEVPAGENPPAGAILYYYFKSPAQSQVKIEILDDKQKLIRSFSSNDPVTAPQLNTVPFPSYWFRPPEKLSTAAGIHRFTWDLRYPPPAAAFPEYSMATAYGQNTPVEPLGPQVLPGTYYVRLVADGKELTKQFLITMDPRVKASPEDLQKQFAWEMKIYKALQQGNIALAEIRSFYAQNKSNPAMAQKIAALSKIEPASAPEPGQPPTSRTPTLSRVLGALQRLAVTVDSADAAPTAQASKGAEEAIAQMQLLLRQWEAIRSE
jgi:hypothetical protein